jgi:hypothetical protein
MTNSLIYSRKQRRIIKAKSWLMMLAVLGSVAWFAQTAQPTEAAGLTVGVAFSDSETTSAETRVVVTFTPITSLASGYIKIYLGPNTTGAEFTDGDTDQTGADIACTQTGSTFGSGAYAAATATVPILYSMSVASGGNTNAVSCTVGGGATDGPNLPNVADGYSVAVITNADSGAGVGYVGNANDITVSATVLPNLALTIDNADATSCITTSGVTACNLGIVTTAAINSGNYDVNVGTNAASGATLKVTADAKLDNGSDDINDVVENNSVVAGTEGNGIAVVSDVAWTEQGDFTDDDTPIPTSPTTVATTAGPIDISGNDVTVTHKVAVSSTTKALTYTQVVTWTATATF